MSKFIVVSGEKGIGKSSLVELLIKKSKKNNLLVCGFYTKGQTNRSFVNAKTGEKWSFTKGHGNVTIVGKFQITADAFKFAQQSLTCKNCDFYLIDEIGRLELQKKGLFDVIKQFLHNEDKLIIACVRLEILDEIERLLGVKIDSTFILTSRNQQREIMEKLLEIIKDHNKNF